MAGIPLCPSLGPDPILGSASGQSIANLCSLCTRVLFCHANLAGKKQGTCEPANPCICLEIRQPEASHRASSKADQQGPGSMAGLPRALAELCHVVHGDNRSRQPFPGLLVEPSGSMAGME